MRKLSTRDDRTEFSLVVAACRRSLWNVFLFSLAINLLMLAMPIYMLQVYDRVISSGNLETLLVLSLIAGAAMIASGCLDIVRNSIAVRTASWLEATLAPSLLRCSLDAQGAGERAGLQPLRDIAALRSFLASPTLANLFDLPWVGVFIALTWLLHPVLGMLAAGGALALFALGVLNEIVTRRMASRQSKTQIKSLSGAERILQNTDSVIAMGMFPALLAAWNKTQAEAVRDSEMISLRGGLLASIARLLRLSLQMAVIGIGAYLVLAGQLTPGAMIAASIMLGRAFGPVEAAMSSWRGFVSARLAYDRLDDLIRAYPAPEQKMQLPRPSGELTLRNVTYTPSAGGAPILCNLSLAVQAGEVLALVGPSGAGKSTLIRVMAGIYQPVLGSVRMDGAKLSDWDADQRGYFVGYLPQEVELFDGTIRDNLTRFNPHDDAGALRAAHLAGVHAMILQLPNGYDTVIGANGVRLSGGQRQQIGLARALYGDPRLLLLDEPNANLDQQGEQTLMEVIRKLSHSGLAIVIAGHRPSTLSVASRIALLNQGQLAAIGARDEMVRSYGIAATHPTEKVQ